ncbi:hypothetical protein ACIQI7_15275 [Kitasatospora sp. NPDC092039]|uniref:hypothetical protein n=1 Tax=Kitasatospora sp. NPDC092039 TaxID=3364086 RepID=UPI0037FC2A60
MSRGLGSRLGRLSGAAAVTLALAFGGVAVGAAPAVAAPLPMDQCTTTSGVVLAVDFGKWGGPLLRSCGTTPTTGYALLNQGGWKTAGTGHDGPAFICRIGYSGFQSGKQYPTPDQDKCVLTPPATAYWSYWHADPGQNDWSYSQLGAMSYQPKPGSVDLWTFGGTNIEGTEGRPAFSPDSLRAHNTTPGGSASDPEPPRPPAGGSSGTMNGGASGGTSGGAGSSGGSAAGTSHEVKQPPAGGGTSGPASGTGGRSAPVSPSAEAPAPPAPAPGVPAEPTAPAETPPAQPTDSPSATDTGGATPTATGDPSSANAAGPTVVDAAPAADAPHESGSVIPAVLGTVLVVVLGVATLVAARQRRRRAE